MSKLTVRISERIEVTVEAVDLMALIKEAAFWCEVPSECPLCRAQLILTYRSPKDFNYYGLKCLGRPSHEVTFGEYKDAAKGLYYKNEWKETQREGQQAPSEQRERQGEDPGFPANPIAGNMSDLITAKQLGMIRALARDAHVDPDEECQRVMSCKCSELSRRAGSALIGHLQDYGANEERHQSDSIAQSSSMRTASLDDVF